MGLFAFIKEAGEKLFGTGEANAAAWLADPNVMAVGGSWLCPAADIRSGNWAGITAMCNSAMKSLKAA